MKLHDYQPTRDHYVLYVTSGDPDSDSWHNVAVDRIETSDVKVGDFVGTMHGIAIWKVTDVRQYVAWANITGILVTSNRLDNIGRHDDFTLSNHCRVFRPID